MTVANITSPSEYVNTAEISPLTKHDGSIYPQYVDNLNSDRELVRRIFSGPLNNLTSNDVPIKVSQHTFYPTGAGGDIPISKATFARDKLTLGTVAGSFNITQDKAEWDYFPTVEAMLWNSLFDDLITQYLECFIYGSDIVTMNKANTDSQYSFITGLYTRYYSLTGPAGGQIIDAGGTGTDNMSILLFASDEFDVKWCYDPRMGPPKTQDSSGPEYREFGPGMYGFQTTSGSDMNGSNRFIRQYVAKMHGGVSVGNANSVVRIANISEAALKSSSAPNLFNLMTEALSRLTPTTPSKELCTFVMAPKLFNYYVQQNYAKSDKQFDERYGFTTGGIQWRKNYFDDVLVIATNVMNVAEDRIV